MFPGSDFIPKFKKWQKFKDATIGITGQEGVLGSIIFKRLLTAGIKVLAYQGDILDIEALNSWFKGKTFSHFFHFAALVPITETEKKPLKTFEVNVIGSFNLCKQLITTQKNCWSFFASSSHVYKPSGVSPPSSLVVNSKTEPTTAYGRSKHAGDLMAHYLLETTNTPHCVGRIFSFTHLGQQEPYLVPTLVNKIEALKDNETLYLINPDSVRDIMDAESVIYAILYLAAQKYNGVINIGCGKGLSVKQIAEFLVKKLGRHLLITGENKSTPNSLVADVTELRRVIEGQ